MQNRERGFYYVTKIMHSDVPVRQDESQIDEILYRFKEAIKMKM